MDLDLDSSLVLAFLALMAGAGLEFVLWFPSSLATGLQPALPFILPLSFVLLAVGAWRLITYFKERGLYEFIMHNSMSALGQSDRPEEVSARLERVELSLGTFERVCLRDMVDLKSRVEMLEKERTTVVSRETIETSPKEPSPQTVVAREELMIREVRRAFKEEQPHSPGVMVNESLRDDSQAVHKEAGSKIAESSSPEFEKPTKEQLAFLKEILNIGKGNLQFKDGSIYNVIAEGKKRVWRKVGRWRDLVSSLTVPYT